MNTLSEIDQRGLDAAYEEACAGRDEGGVPIGSVLMTKDGTIVARGHNLREQTGDSTAHAETVCFRNAGRRRDWHELVLVSTLSPCAMCTGTAILHQIPRVVIGERENFEGREDWMHSEGVEVVIANDQRCIELMRTFIKEHPDLWHEDIGIPPDDGCCGRGSSGT